MKELRDGVLIVIAPTLLFLFGARLFESTSAIVSGFGAVAMSLAFAFGCLVGGFGMLLIFGGVLRMAFGRFFRSRND